MPGFSSRSLNPGRTVIFIFIFIVSFVVKLVLMSLLTLMV